MGPIKLIFLDIPAGVAIDEIIELTTPFHDFLAVLSRMSASVQEQIQGLGRRYEAKESGLNLSDGCWWYRIVKITSSVKIASINAQGAEKTLSQHTKGDWCRLATLFAYDHMREIELVGGLPMDQGWVEVHHDLQKKRDEMTAIEACEKDKDWRSSIGHTKASPQDEKASLDLTSASTSLTNTSNTSLQVEREEDAAKNDVKGHKHAESDSVGSCSSTEQVKQLLEEYTAHAHPLVIEWPRPPRCTLMHLNEDYVAQDAESRNHHPVLFASFEKDEVHVKGLPSYAPRPGPFPAQIGKPPSTGYCAYEIRNDIEYRPDSPSLEDARIRPASHTLHDERYHGNNSSQSKATIANVEPLQTSISMPDQTMQYDMESELFEPVSQPMQSAPAHMQSFPEVPWTGINGTVGHQQSGQRFSSQGSYRSQSFGNAPYQGARYFISGSYDRPEQQSGYLYQPQSSLRSSSGPVQTYQSHAPPRSPLGAQFAPHPSFPPPPQEVVSKIPSPRALSFPYGHGGLENFGFPTGSSSNFDAMKESEILNVTAQSQQHHASYQMSQESSRRPIPNQYLRSNSANMQTSEPYPPSRSASRQQNHVPLPGFSYHPNGLAAPTFTTANAFSDSFDALTRELGPNWPYHGAAADPALDANQGLALQSQWQHAHQNNVVSVPTDGPVRGRKPFPMRSASQGQPQVRWSDNQFKQGNRPIHGQFSPPKPRMEGKYAVKVLNRYNRSGSTQSRAPDSATTGGTMEQTSSGPPSVVFRAKVNTASARRNSSDRISSAPSLDSEASNFSDVFVINDSRKSKNKGKTAKAKASRKARATGGKRGAAKETDAVKTVGVEEAVRNERDAAEARAARIMRRSSGKMEVEAGAEVAVESRSMMNEG